jgi:16S rRNA (guanine966-N2)-methyltransferase
MKPKHTAPPAGEVRIIGGQWRRSKLPVAAREGLRPTADRVRETLFNWLGQDLTGWRCLDAFAGSGALGFEAASRGAAQVLCVEQDRLLANQLTQNKSKLQAANIEVRCADALSVLATARDMDAIFLDPPFRSGDELFSKALRAAAQALAPNGWIYLEAPRAWGTDELQALGLAQHRYLKAGMAHAHLLCKAAAA